MTNSKPGKRQRRSGRGQLSSIDLLPENADSAILWANGQLRERSMPQGEILREFNARLADLGVAPISRSAFSRHSVRLAIEMRKMSAAREITNVLLERVPPGERDDMMIAAVEIVKAQILQVVMDGDEPDAKALAHASLTLARLSAIRQREAEGKRRSDQYQRELDERAEQVREKERRAEEEKSAANVDRIATEAGLSAEAIANIRKGVLGLTI